MFNKNLIWFLVFSSINVFFITILLGVGLLNFALCALSTNCSLPWYEHPVSYLAYYIVLFLLNLYLFKSKFTIKRNIAYYIFSTLIAFFLLYLSFK